MFLIFDAEINSQFLIKDSIFEEISFKNGSYAFLITWSNTVIENSLFRNISCSRSIFFKSPNHITAFKSILIVKSCYFLMINGSGTGPISLLSNSNANLTFEDTFFSGIISGYSLFFPITAEKINYLFRNVTFSNIFFKFGYILFILKGQNAVILNCTFKEIFFYFPSIYRAVFRVLETKLIIDSSIFSNIRVYNGSGELIMVQNKADLQINNTIIDGLIVEGKGGIHISSESNFFFNCSQFRNSRNDDEGFIRLIDMKKIEVENSKFSNLSSFKYTLFFIENFENLTVGFCEFSNIIAGFESTVFFIIASKNVDSAIIFFKGNFFQNNVAKKSVGGGLSFLNCFSPIFIEDNIFTGSVADSGACIFADNVTSLYLTNCLFKDSYASTDGAVFFMMNVQKLQIKSSNFSNNMVNYGKGANIYLENCNLTIESTNFRGGSLDYEREMVQGSAIYAFYSGFIFGFDLKDCEFTRLTQDSSVIFITSDDKAKILINFQSLNFEEISSKNGNGILTLIQCVGLINQTKIANSLIYKGGNMIDLFNIGLEKEIELEKIKGNKLEIHRFISKNNIMFGNGIFFKVYNLEFIEFKDCEFLNNSIMNNFIAIEDFTTVSIVNLQCINNSIYDTNMQTKLFANFLNGSNINVNGVLFHNLSSLFFGVSSSDEIILHNISIFDHYDSNMDYFLLIEKTNRTVLSNWLVYNSKITCLNIKSETIRLEDITIEEIKLYLFASEAFLLYLSSESQNGEVFINNMILNNVNYGVIIDEVSKANISSFYLDNSQFSQNSFFALKLRTISTIFISNSNIHGITSGSGIIIQNLQNNFEGTIELFNSSINSCGSDTTGGLNITGNYLTKFSSMKFESNRGVPGSAFSFYTFSNSSKLFINNSQFSKNQTAYLIIPSIEFYENFKKTHHDFLQTSQLEFSSYTSEIRASIVENSSSITNYNKEDIVVLYSGQKIDIQLIAYDHFNRTSDTVDYMGVEILKGNSSNYEIFNTKAIFQKSLATILSFFIKLEPENITNEVIELKFGFGALNKKSSISNINYNFSIWIRMKPCDIGHILSSNICIECDYKSYSLEQNPSNLTQCIACPLNALCHYGRFIVPNKGFWNLNENDPEIIQCETKESCNNTCVEGYFGYVCHECQAHYGKTLIRRCKKCTDSYLNDHILRAVFKWLILALISCYQFQLINKLDDKKSKILLSLINIFVYHSNIFAMSSRFQEDFPVDFENFLEVQSVFSFFENNLYMIYCMYPGTRDSNFNILMFIYFLLIPVFQLVFIVIIFAFSRAFNFFLNKNNEKFDKKNILDIVCILFNNNFITLFYYFIGLVFFFNVNKKVSIYFMELGLNSQEFFILLFLIVLAIFLIYCVFFVYFVKKNKQYEILLLFDSDYKEKYKKIGFIHYICLFFTIVFSHYSFVGSTFSSFVKNVFMLYLGIIAGFKAYKSPSIQMFKILSLITLLVSFFQNFQVIMVLNSLFYVTIFIYVIKKTFFDNLEDYLFKKKLV